MAEWKPIEGFEHEYFISDSGQVYSTRLKSCLSLSPPNYVVNLWNTEGNKHFSVARLVATHFLEPTDIPGAVVWHKDRDSSNNNIDNLVWMSRSDSCRQKQTLEQWRDSTARKYGLIYCFGPEDEILTARSIREASELTGVSKSGIQYAITHDTAPRGWIFERYSLQEKEMKQ